MSMVSQSDITYRLRGIPGHHGKAEVCQLVARLLQLDASTVDVRSLAWNPFQEAEKVATLTFSEPPQALQRDTLDVVFDTNFYGVTPLHGIPDEECDTDCIALSGLNGHAFGSFKAKGDNFMWIRDALPKDMPKSRIYVYGYDTSMISSLSRQNLLDLGSTFAEFLKNIAISSNRKNFPPRTLLLIGHSLGGLVLEQAIVALVESGPANEGVWQALKGILLFGVPHLGMLNQPLIPMVRDQPNEGLVACLKTDSELLELQQKNFAAAHPRLNDAKVIAFFETVETPTVEQDIESKRWTMTGSPAILVSKSSATLGCNTALPINRNHSEIVKFPHQDNDYFVVLGRLKELRRQGQQKQNVQYSNLDQSQETALRSLAFSEQHWRKDELNPGDNTCEWLLQDSSFKTWLDTQNQDQKLLWIAGNPGTGKSTMMKYAFDFIRQQHQADQVLVSFFFHGRGTPLQRTKLGFLRSVLYQLLRRIQDSLPIFMSYYKEKKLATSGNDVKWAEVELERIFLDIIQQLGTTVRICLLVDALDESGEGTAQDLVNFLRKITTFNNAKSLFSCRRYPILRTSCKLHVSMETENENDIQTVVSTLLTEEFQDTEEAKALEESILGKAGGMFQWAVLVTKSIVQEHTKLGSSIIVLQETIEKLPQDLHKLYASLLQADEEEERSQTIKLLRWILFSIRPLTAKELQHALVTDAEDMPSSIYDFRNSPHFIDPKKGIITLSKGLAEIKHHADNEIAQFIHQSVPDYLLMGGGLGNLIGSTSRTDVVGASHFAISRSCLNFALLPEILSSIGRCVDYDEGPSTNVDPDENPFEEVERLYPLAKYVHDYWIPHIMHVESDGIDQKDLLVLLQKRETDISLLCVLWKSGFQPNYCGWNRDILDILADDEQRFKDTWGWDENNPQKQSRKYSLDYEHPWKFWDSPQLDGLYGALDHAWHDDSACVNIVNMLSLAGIRSALRSMGRQAFNRVPFKAHWSDREMRTSPLLFSLLANPSLKLEDIPEDLTTDEVNVDPSEYFSPLILAVATERVELVQRFINAGADVNRFCGTYPITLVSPLYVAAYNENQDLARILINAGAYPNLDEEGWDSLLEDTWERGNEQMFTLLIEAGVETKETLASAIEGYMIRDKTGCIKKLLEIGPNPNATVSGGTTLFLNALRTFDRKTIGYFLQCRRLDPDLVDGDGRTPLMRVVIHGSLCYEEEKFVENCLSTGRFDLEIRDRCGDTLLSHAVKKGLVTICGFLLTAGVDPNIPDIHGRTALMKAAYYRMSKPMELLLACDRTDVDAFDNWQLTALCYTVPNAEVVCANLLLASGKLDLEDSRRRLLAVCFAAMDRNHGGFLRCFSDLKPKWFYRELVELMWMEARRLGKTHIIVSLADAHLVSINGDTM